jgi:hypothetical protein
MLTASTLGFKSGAGEARILSAGADAAKATERLKGFRVPMGNAAGEDPLIGGKKNGFLPINCRRKSHFGRFVLTKKFVFEALFPAGITTFALPKVSSFTARRSRKVKESRPPAGWIWKLNRRRLLTLAVRG